MWLWPCLLVFLCLNPAYSMLEERNTDQFSLNEQRSRPCDSCLLASASLPQGKFIHMKFSTTHGYGRTGNYIISMRNALNLAYLCKAVLELPALDDEGNAFDFSSHRFFDFRSLKKGDALQAPECRNTEENALYFWFLQFGTHHRQLGSPQIRRLPAIDEVPASTEINRCLREYLGICNSEKYCHGLKDVTNEQTIVVHLRHGDLYPANFTSKDVSPEYGQPPLSFYLSIFDFVKPKRIIIVAEPSHEGPVWKALHVLQEHNALRYEIEFRSGPFREDLRFMLCAETFVESRSSLMSLVRLGFASRIFTAGECYKSTFAKIYSCGVSEEYKQYYERHTNGASEWVDALLQGSQVPHRCQV